MRVRDPPGVQRRHRGRAADHARDHRRPDSALAVEIARAVADRFGSDVVKVQLTIGHGGLPHAPAAGRGDPGPPGGGRDRGTPPARLVDDPASLRVLDMPSFFSASMRSVFLFFAAAGSAWSACSRAPERHAGPHALGRPSGRGWILAGKMRRAVRRQRVIAMTILVVARPCWSAPTGEHPRRRPADPGCHRGVASGSRPGDHTSSPTSDRGGRRGQNAAVAINAVRSSAARHLPSTAGTGADEHARPGHATRLVPARTG